MACSGHPSVGSQVLFKELHNGELGERASGQTLRPPNYIGDWKMLAQNHQVLSGITVTPTLELG